MRPAYEEIIPFYRELYLAQEDSKKNLDLSPVIIADDVLKMRKENELPLISPEQFPFDHQHASILLKKLCTIAKKMAPALKKSANTILEAELDTEQLFNDFIKNNTASIRATVKKLAIHEEHLILLAASAIAPAVETGAQQLAHYLEKENSDKDNITAWDKGFCPICGSLPQIGYIKENGERHLICGFCLHHFKTGRTGCALCRNREKDQQQYFYSDDEKEYRVDLCNHCKRYIKIIDLRELERPFYPQLELVATIHLDMKAIEQGYSNLLEQ